LNPDWQAIFDAADTLELWNKVVLPLMLDPISGTMEFKRQAHAIARGRNYEYKKDLAAYVQAWAMKPVKMGRQLVTAGAQANVLRVGYQGKDRITYYLYRTGDATRRLDMLIRNPFPDALLRRWVKKFNWRGERES
jgi:hypothetical protein